MKAATYSLLVSILVIAFSPVIKAQCVVVDSLTGWAIKERNNYAVEADGFSSDKFYLNWAENEGEDSWMSNMPNEVRISCVNLGILVCVDRKFVDQAMMWSIDIENNKVIHSRTIASGVGFGGAMIMTGEIAGYCDSQYDN